MVQSFVISIFERSGLRRSAKRIQLDQHANYLQILKVFNVEIVD